MTSLSPSRCAGESAYADGLCNRVMKSPAALVGMVVLSIFMVELGLMAGFEALPPMDAWTAGLLDGALLIALVSPILYLFLFRPLCRNVAALRDAKQALKHQRDHLEQEVRLRTGELLKSSMALETSLREIGDLYQNAPFGYHSTDKNGVVVRMNNTELSWLGYARHEIVGRKKLKELLTPKSAAAFPGQFADLLRLGALKDLEAEFVRKDGSAYPALVNVSAVYDEQGEFLMTRASVYDITRRKTAEQEREQYFKLFNSSTDLMGISNRSGMMLKVNRAFTATLGYSEAELLARPFSEVLHPDDRQGALAERPKLLQQGYMVDLQNRYLCKDGSVRWLSWSAIVDDEEDLIYSTGRDITEKKEGEQRLFNSNQLLERVFNTTHVCAVYLDRAFNFIRVNQAYADACGYPADHFAGKNHFDLYPHDENEAIFRQVVRTGEVYTVAAKPFTFPDHPEWGVTYWDWTLHPLKSPGGEVDALLFVLLDVTERKRSELALGRFTEELEIQVAERTAELAHAKKAAEEANHAKTRFLAAASHDLRQPLTALRLYADVLRGKLPEEDRAVSVQIDECVGSLSGLLSKLLDLSKLEAGGVTPRTENFALDELLHKVLSAHAPEAAAKGLDLRLARGVSGIVVRTDPVLFQRIVGNLVDNAIHYTSRGGVLIACRRREGRRWVEVWDTGIGIPPDRIGEVFEEFRQLGDDARTHGSGLGLTIVAKTAMLLGLEIRVLSRPGQGSMFAVELPLGRAGRAEDRPRPGSRPEGAHIAAVDDNPMALKALVCALEAAGHTVTAAPGGSALLAALGGEAPDVLLCDYRLAGGETGLDVIEAVRAAFGSLPALVLTGDTDPNLMRSMAEQGILILHKPVDVEDLQARIGEALKAAGAA